MSIYSKLKLALFVMLVLVVASLASAFMQLERIENHIIKLTQIDALYETVYINLAQDHQHLVEHLNQQLITKKRFSSTTMKALQNQFSLDLKQLEKLPTTLAVKKTIGEISINYHQLWQLSQIFDPAKPIPSRELTHYFTLKRQGLQLMEVHLRPLIAEQITTIETAARAELRFATRWLVAMLIFCLLVVAFIIAFIGHQLVRPLSQFNDNINALPFDLYGENDNSKRPKRVTSLTSTLHDKLEHILFYDTLTNLPNRNLVMKQLKHTIHAAKKSDYRVAIIFSDLDRFSHVNTTFGHTGGDYLLKTQSTRLQENTPPFAFTARFGGNVFLQIIPELDSQSNFLAFITRHAKKLVKQIAEPVEFHNTNLHTTASIGIVIYPQDAKTINEILQHGNAAINQAKSFGRNTFQYYSKALNEDVRKNLQLEYNLREALDKDQLQLVFQPQCDLKTGQIIGAETLVRWELPEQGHISPEKFITIAEETDLIIPISEWILRAACRQYSLWKTRGYQISKLAINLSARQFQRHNLPYIMGKILQDTGLNPECIEFEVTESAIMEDLSLAIAVLRELQQLGIKIAMDDFGTGHSSLSQLKKLPIDILKIDRSFVVGIHENPGDAAILQTIINLAHHLSLQVIVEGVDDPAQIKILNHYRCEVIQGFYITKPLPAKEFLDFLDQWDASSITALTGA